MYSFQITYLIDEVLCREAFGELRECLLILETLPPGAFHLHLPNPGYVLGHLQLFYEIGLSAFEVHGTRKALETDGPRWRC